MNTGTHYIKYTDSRRLSTVSKVTKRFSVAISVRKELCSSIARTFYKVRSWCADVKSTTSRQAQDNYSSPPMPPKLKSRHVDKRDISKPVYIPRPASLYHFGDAFVRARSDSLISTAETTASLEVVCGLPLSTPFSDYSTGSYSSLVPDLIASSPADASSSDLSSIASVYDDDADTLYEPYDEQPPFYWDDVLDYYENCPIKLLSPGFSQRTEARGQF